MANHKSDLKRARQSKVRRLRNLSFKTRVKNAVKDVKVVAASDSPDLAEEKLAKAVSIIQKTATKGIIHKKKASRKVSSLTRLVNQMTPS